MNEIAVPIEMYLGIMGGCVHAAFLMVLEVVVLSKQACGIFSHLRLMHQSGNSKRLFTSICGIAAFFLIQPVITTALVVSTLNGLDPNFSVNFTQELKQALGAVD